MKIACLLDIRSLTAQTTGDGQLRFSLDDGRVLPLKRCTSFGGIVEIDVPAHQTWFPFPQVEDLVTRVEASEDLGYNLVVPTTGVVRLKDFSAILIRREPAPTVTYLARSWKAWCAGRGDFFTKYVKERATAL